MSSSTLAGIPIRNTRDLINPDTRFCGMVYARNKFGKTTFGATLDKMTRRFYNKPTLVIAVEPGEGGGTMSVQEWGLDFVAPTSYEEFSRILAALATDTTYAGVVLDSATEYAQRMLKPFAMKFPSKQKTPQRMAGVPEWGDYQTMGEQARIHFNQLIALTVHSDLNIRKHLLVTACYKERMDEDGRNIIKIHPDLPGAMADNSTAMFQTVGVVELKVTVEPVNGKPQRVTRRVYQTEADGVRVIGDRTKMLPAAAELDMEVIWEKYWLPKLALRYPKEVQDRWGISSAEAA